MDPATAKMALQIASTLARSRTARYLIIGLIITSILAGLATMFGPWLLMTQLAAGIRHSDEPGGSDGGSCPTQPGTPGRSNFTDSQVGHARTIWSVAQEMSAGDHGAIVGIATALQESTLRNLPYGDRDSVGLFQQRASWGSYADRMDPVESSRMFFAALTKVQGWQDMSVAEAAQSVQLSAFPDAYAKHERPAAGLVALFTSGTNPDSPDSGYVIDTGMCGPPDAASCPTTRLPVEHGLTPDALRVLRCLKDQWPHLQSFAGIGERPANVDRDHQEGRAVDAMIPKHYSITGRRLGGAIARWAVTNHQRLGIKYVIWNEQIWNVERQQEGWRTCGTAAASCYTGPDATAAHRDHVHISVFGNQAGSKPDDRGPIVVPVDDYILTARFGQCSSHWANCHTGIDFAAPNGTPIRAVMSGTVAFTGLGSSYGNLTKIDHPGDVQTWYAHQSAIIVQAGETVTAGEIIGRLGSTGNTTGPHLHLEVRAQGVPVDPEQWLNARGVAP